MLANFDLNTNYWTHHLTRTFMKRILKSFHEFLNLPILKYSAFNNSNVYRSHNATSNESDYED